MSKIESKELKAQIKILNAELEKSERIKVVGETTAALADALSVKVVEMHAADADNLPESVFNYYNENLASDEPKKSDKKKSKKTKTAEKGKKDKKSKKEKGPKKEKAPSMEQITQTMLNEGKSDKQIAVVFVRMYAKKGKDEEFARARANKYIHQEKRNLGMVEKKVKPAKKEKASKNDDSKKEKKSKKDKKSKKSKK